MLQVDRSRDAAATLAPRVADALVQPDKPTNAQVLLAYAVALARSGGQPKASEMIHALAERSPSWRTLPLDARPEWLGDGDTAERWLAACSREVPPADVAARLRMAEAWGSAWERFRSPPLLARAREVLATITSAADAPARAYFVSARLSESEGDRPAASKAYEEAIARDPGQAGARNNLACLLADAGKWEAAVEQGNRLVAEHPRVPEFVDTLAYALRKGRKFDEARKRMEQAVDLDPSNPAWRVGLAEAMVEAGDKAAAAKVLAAVDAMATAGTTIAPELRSRIDGVRNGLR
jgi:Tfp pilus assembly protein PilF